MAVYRDIDYNTRINGGLTVSEASTFSNNLTVQGSLTVNGGIVGIDLSNYYTKTQLQTSGQAQVHWDNITGMSSSFAQLGGSNVFTATSDAIKLKPSSDTSTTYTNEAVVFNTDTKTLANKPIDSSTETVKSATSGGTTYTRDEDYTINYFTGQITRVATGSITAGQTVYVDYTKTVKLFSIENPAGSTTYFSIDNRGNIYGKSITVNLSSSSSSSSGGSVPGDFTIEGNLSVNGNSNLGNGLTDILTVNAQADFLGEIRLNGTRKDGNWDSAYTHSTSAHAPSDAPSNATFTGHTGNSTVHITSTERTNWGAAYTHSGVTGNPHGTTKTDLSLGNVENKSSATIRGEITSSNVTTALGFTPVNKAGDTMSGTLTVDTYAKIASPVGLVTGIDATLTATQGSSWSELRAVDTKGFIVRTSGDSGSTWNNVLVAYYDSFTYNGNNIWHAGNLTPMPTSGGTFTGSVTFPGTGIWNSSGNVGIGTTTPTAGYKLDVNGALRGGQFTSTVADGTAPFNITSKTTISNLSADMVDNVHAADLFDAALNIGGYGVVSGLKVYGLGTSLGVRVTSGLVYIKGYGYKQFAVDENLTSGFEVNAYHVVFIAGTSVAPYVQGGIGVKKSLAGWPDMTTPDVGANPIILAKVHPTASVISDNDITPCRQFMTVKTDLSNSMVKIFEADKENHTAASSAYVSSPMFEMAKVTNKAKLTIRDISFNDASVNNNMMSRKITIQSDSLTFEAANDTLDVTTTATITATKVGTWDSAGTKQHEHVYDAAWSGPTTNGTTFTLTSGDVLQAAKTKVFKNGLRQKYGASEDYTLSGPAVIFNTAPAATDKIIIDYDK